MIPVAKGFPKGLTPRLGLPDHASLSRPSGPRSRWGQTAGKASSKIQAGRPDDLPQSKGTSARSFWTALAIVPPQEHWDRIQRARHYARDSLFHQWPPAIRLFHPFSPPVTSASSSSPLVDDQHGALEVAQVVEELDLEPFEITLDTWVIVPHLEALENAWRNSLTVTTSGSIEDEDDGHVFYDHDFYTAETRREDEETRRLIEQEERIGLDKAKARAAKLSQTTGARKPCYPPKVTGSSNQTSTAAKSPRDILEEQKQQYEEFGGPCILCLEPNAESKQMLQDLREEMALLLSHDDYSSPSSIYSWRRLDPVWHPEEYRPLIPVSSFDSLPAALDVARRLKGLWGGPLTFSVEDLHLLSCWEEFDPTDFAESDNLMGAWQQEESRRRPWSCSAKIMLMGKEHQDSIDEMDDEQIQAMVQKLVEEGQAGGMDISDDFTILDDEEVSDIEHWLDSDDDFDEGMKVTIGRTHFYTGDQALYNGMPASSVLDSKDRSLGSSPKRVSALARRRRNTAGAQQWDDGQFGRRERDYLPWGKRELAGHAERLLNDDGMTSMSYDESDDASGDDESNTDESSLLF